MRRSDFDFHLPPELIAQHPIPDRSASRLFVLDGGGAPNRHLVFRDLPTLLEPNDLLVLNDTRVVPARVYGIKDSGGRVEILLERAVGEREALVHARASKGLREGARVQLPGGHEARMRGRDGDLYLLEFSAPVLEYFEAHGDMPLPPYIERAPDLQDRERYQTVYARVPGAVAAPTAGLHFDAQVFAALDARGVRRAHLTLHVGAGTFQPVRSDEVAAHRMHGERVVVPRAVCEAIAATRAAGGRVVAVGTTVVRSLEAAAAAAAASGGVEAGEVAPYEGVTELFITPGYRFRVVDAMVTNFHLPQSTLVMLCAAFVGRERLLAAYAEAVRERYRFFSYGDAMLLTPAPGARASAA